MVVLNEGLDVMLAALALAAKYQLTARRIHDARHAAAALESGITEALTTDHHFEQEGFVRLLEP